MTPVDDFDSGDRGKTPAGRIDALERTGKVSGSQAARLRRALAHSQRPSANGGGDSGAAASGRRRQGRFLLWGGVSCLLLAILVLALLSGGESQPPLDVAASLNDSGVHGEMNRSLSLFLVAAIALALPLLVLVFLYNALIAKEERVFESWAQVESTLQRRADLIPALVESVKAYTAHEAGTLAETTAARAGTAARLSENLEKLIEAQEETRKILGEGGRLVEDGAALSRLFAAQAGVGRGMTALLAVAEDYPDLKASDQYLELQAQLEGTENRINVARQRFNASVGNFNAAMRKLPWNLVAGLGSFRRKAYFQAAEGAGDAPDLGLD